MLRIDPSMVIAIFCHNVQTLLAEGAEILNEISPFERRRVRVEIVISA